METIDQIDLSKINARSFQVKLPDGTVREVMGGTPVRELLPAKSPNGLDIVAVKFNNKVASLDRPVDRDGELALIDLKSRDGGLIYRRSLTFLLIRAVSEIYEGLHVYINHSLNNGYYGEIYNESYGENTHQPLAQSDIDKILARMRAIVERNEPFTRREMPVPEAIDLFEKAGLHDKVKLLKYRLNETTSVYQCGAAINHFYGQLLPSTGLLTDFDLKLCGPGFVLVFPQHGKPGKMPDYHHAEKLFNVYQEYENWARILGIRTVADLNELVDTRQINEYVLIAEALMEKKISGIADRIMNNPRKPRIILLSGPSASGKTTTVKRLSIQLRVLGLRPVLIGLDDFFVERDRTPKDEAGDYDFEAFQAIDVELLQSCVRRLIKGEEVTIPKFDFIQGKPVPGKTLKLTNNQPLILEGIHGLNPDLLPGIPDGIKFKIYISPLSHLNIDDHNRIASSDARLIRRLVRDHRYRGYDGVATVGRWPSVRRGEEKNIFPYQEEADYVFNSALPYEVSVMKQFAVPVLQGIPRESPLFSEAARLIKFMSYYRDLKENIVPRHSLLREFIGGSSFKY